MNPFRRNHDAELPAELSSNLRALRAEAPSPASSAAGRKQLHAAVAAASPVARPKPRLRFTALAVAGLSGLGLLAASAATGSDPVNLVRDTVTDIPRPWAGDRASRVELQGTILRVDDSGHRIIVETDDRGPVRLDVTGARVTDARSPETDVAALEPGDRVDIRAEGRNANDLDARTIKVDRPASDTAPSDGRDPNLAANDEPTPRATPTPRPTDSQPNPTATRTLHAGANSGADQPRPTSEPTKSPVNDVPASTPAPPTDDDQRTPIPPVTPPPPSPVPPDPPPDRPKPVDNPGTNDANDGAP